MTQLAAHPIIKQYSESFNTSSFETTTALFADDGQLHLPFADPVVGNTAICQYLQAEAESMQSDPNALERVPQSDWAGCIIVQGWVKVVLI